MSSPPRSSPPPSSPPVGPTPLPTDAEFDAVAEALGHRFASRPLLLEALTHRSFAHERPKLAPRHNERLEFLGDALVGAAVAALLHRRFPDASEGDLTRRRAALVCEEGLAVVARELGLGAALRLGKGERKTGGAEKPRLLASAFEAVIGAVLVDADAATAWACVARHFDARLDADGLGERDAKSSLQEAIQPIHGKVPRYAMVGAEGPDHERVFTAAVRVGEREIGRGEGRSKVDAEQAAAKDALTAIGQAGGPEAFLDGHAVAGVSAESPAAQDPVGAVAVEP